MKLRSSICLIFCVFLLLLPFSLEPQAGGPLPFLVLEKEVFDFGSVQEGSRISHAFQIVNQGTAPLEIRKITPG